MQKGVLWIEESQQRTAGNQKGGMRQGVLPFKVQIVGVGAALLWAASELAAARPE
jgi:hypothetical protein